MSQEQTYKIIKIFAEQSGVSERGAWRSQEIIVQDTADVQYPDQYLLHFAGSSVDKLQGMTEGTIVKAQWSAHVREYQKDGKEYHSQQLKCWKIENVTTF